MKTHLEIGGMMCEACVGHVKTALQNVPHVREVQVELASQRATVEHENADMDALITAVEDEGYTAKIAAL